eukprot:3922672-Prymnesium_polylepis.2
MARAGGTGAWMRSIGLAAGAWMRGVGEGRAGGTSEVSRSRADEGRGVALCVSCACLGRSQADEAVLRGNLLHHLHHHQILVDLRRRDAKVGRTLVLVGSDLAVARVEWDCARRVAISKQWRSG